MVSNFVRAAAGASLLASAAAGLSAAALAQDPYANWVPMKSSFPSTGGGGITIKGYDPVVIDGKCLTTFMAVESGDKPNVYPNFIEYAAQPVAGGILCSNGKWRAFDGGQAGTTDFRMFYRDGRFFVPPG